MPPVPPRRDDDDETTMVMNIDEIRIHPGGRRRLAPGGDSYRPRRRRVPLLGGARIPSGVVWVGGVGAGRASPAGGMAPDLAEALRDDSGIASLQVRYRRAVSLEESIMDTLAGAAFLESEGVEAVGLVGHSLGGAVVIQAAAADPAVRTVVALATQSYGTDPVEDLGPRCAILLLHGAADRVLPFAGSQQVHERAAEPKRLVVYPDTDHNLDEAAEEVRRTVRDWLAGELSRAAGE